MGKLPAITHGGAVVTEAAAVCAYLADAFPAAALAPPPGDQARAPYFRWLFFAAGPVEAVVTAKMLGVDVKPEQKRMVGYGDAADTMNALESAISGRDFIAGDRFSAADVYVASQLGWGMQFGSIEKRPAFEAYVARHQARPAAVRAREIDDKLLAEQPAPQPAS
jgi:glutathione S-transferase